MKKNKKIMNILKHSMVIVNYILKNLNEYSNEINKKKSLEFHLKITSGIQSQFLFENYIDLQKNQKILVDQQLFSIVTICSILNFYKILISKINKNLYKKFENNIEHKKLMEVRNAWVHPEYLYKEKQSIIPSFLFGIPKRLMNNFELSYCYDSYYKNGTSKVLSGKTIDIFDSFEKILKFLSNKITQTINKTLD